MALVKGPAMSVAASGNMADICYSSWRGMAVARGVWTGTVPNTTKQRDQQAFMTTVSQAWGGTLNAVERLTWIERAKTVIWRNRLGNSYIPTGYQLFMKWNIRRLVMGLSLMNNAPGKQEWVETPVFQAVTNAAKTAVKVWLKKKTFNSIDSYGVEYYKAGTYDSGGRNPIEGEWRCLTRLVPPNSYLDNEVILGKWYWYRGRQVTEFGAVGNWFESQVQFI